MDRRKFLKSMGAVGAGSALMMAFPGCLPKSGAPAPAESGGQNFTGKLGVLSNASWEHLPIWVEKYQELYGVLPNSEIVTSIDLQDKLTSSFVARSSSWDAVYTIPALEASCASNGWLEDLSERVANSDVFNGKSGHKFLEGGLNTAKYNGKFFGVPVHFGGTSLIYNKKLMMDNDLDPDVIKDWHSKKNSYDEFLRYAKAMSYSKGGTDYYGLVDNWLGTEVKYTFFTLLQMHGGKAIDENEQPLFNSDAGVETLEKMVSWLNIDKIIDPASLTYSWVFDLTPSFLSGNRGFLISWPFVGAYGNAESTSDSKGHFDIAPNFSVDTSACVDGAEFYSIPTFAKNPDEAFRWLEHICSYDMQREMAMQGSWMSPYIDILDDPEIIAVNPVAAVFRKSYEYPTATFVSPNYLQWTEILGGYINDALNQKLSPKDALNEAAKAMAAM